MIKSHDRSGWFGASDAGKVMGRWNGKSFEKWWLVKLGVRSEDFTTEAMKTGTALEHRILEHIGVRRMDRQIKIRRLLLRVNLDGETRDCIHEVKTHSSEVFQVTKAYWQQCQVEMFAARKPCRIVSYHVLPEDHRNWFLPIDDSRLGYHPVPYDQAWIKEAYLPRLRYLAECLRKGAWPDGNAV